MEDNNIQKITDFLSDIIAETNFNEITGEIISIKPSDKHLYLTVKNQDYQINCIFWNKTTNDINDKIKDGDKIKITGFLSIMKKNLSIYFNVKKIEKIGSGNYMHSFIELKNKIINLGWTINKKSITPFPFNIGIITSLEGAALQDILQTFKLDSCIGNIYLKNALVQGKQCPSSVISGIKYFNDNFTNIDVLLITRGGGSNEDLIGFSDFNLLQEIHSCKFVTISAVGHQIDNQLSDLVCDYNFATPSIAAKFIIEKQKTYLDNIRLFHNNLYKLLDKFKDTKVIFNNIDYSKKIKAIEDKEIKDKLLLYKNNLNYILSLYNRTKVKLLNNISSIKPTIYKKNKITETNTINDIEITSITDFIDPYTGEEKKKKKLKLVFNDGNIDINYKITNYELFD
jgi:exodeoxyribonuclease VII large subunit